MYQGIYIGITSCLLSLKYNQLAIGYNKLLQGKSCESVCQTIMRMKSLVAGALCVVVSQWFFSKHYNYTGMVTTGAWSEHVVAISIIIILHVCQDRVNPRSSYKRSACRGLSF